MVYLAKTFAPNAATNRISKEQKSTQVRLSEIAFPLYCMVPVLGDFLRRKEISVVCPSFEACGGVWQSLFNFAIYLFLVEAAVFWIHYWLLHVWPTGKTQLKHHVHHSFKLEHEMSVWTGYAFEAVDGSAQGLPFVIFQCLIPIPYPFMVLSGAITGVWTMYIHMGDFALPWPFMGADYHHLHHVYNWYNFGLFTRFFDWLFSTLREPHSKQEHAKDAELFRGKDW